MLSFTEQAAAKVKEIRAAERIADDQGLRVMVVGGGCAGFRYDLFFDDAKAEDRTFDAGGVTVLVDPMSLSYIEGTEVDYVETLESAGFRFKNPKATQSCGCGSSFCG